MPDNRQGSFRLFRVAGIDVSIHWSWFLVAAFDLQYRKNYYSSPAWNVAEYLTLFAIVLLHEFGHALACRQTGGKSDHITLWPLGGIAYVQPPPRPGAVLWSIAAGPLVNVALMPLLIGIQSVMVLARFENPDLWRYLYVVTWRINLGLLIFNILPIYPLDGGQILRALLWFVIGRAKSLLVACVIGVVGCVAILGYAFYLQSVWLGIIAVFVLQQCWFGFKQVKALAQLEKLPKRDGFVCPECGEVPHQGEFWVCKCGARFDMFATNGVCPQCHEHHEKAGCTNCGQFSEFEKWKVAP